MTEARKELRDAVSRALCQEKCAFYGETPCWGLNPDIYELPTWNPDDCDEPGCGALADAAIAVVGERLSKVAQGVTEDRRRGTDYAEGYWHGRDVAAAAIRSLTQGE